MINETFRWMLKRYMGSLLTLLVLGLVLPSVLRILLNSLGFMEPIDQVLDGRVTELGFFGAVFPQLLRWVAAGIGISLPLYYFGSQLLRGGTRTSLMVASWGILAILAAGLTVISIVNLLLEGRGDTLAQLAPGLLYYFWYALLGLTVANVFLRVHWIWGVVASAGALGFITVLESGYGGSLVLTVVMIPLLMFLSVFVLRRAVPPAATA